MNAKILIAEGDTSARLERVAVLEGEGYSVAAAGDEVQALRLFGQQRFDLLIVGSMASTLGGQDFCGSLRTRDFRLPILFLAIDGDEFGRVVHPKLTERDEYLKRPVSVREFLARVEVVLRRSRAVERAAHVIREN